MFDSKADPAVGSAGDDELPINGDVRTGPRRAGRRASGTPLAIAAIIVLIGSLLGAWALGRSSGLRSAGTDGPVEASVVAVPVEQRELLDEVVLRADAVYADTHVLAFGSGGRVTSIVDQPSIDEGSVVGEVDGNPIVVLSGDRPTWRDVSARVSGADVLQLEEALVRLGYDAGLVDGLFSGSTEAAWQTMLADRGFSDSDRIVGIGEVIFVPFSLPVTAVAVDAEVGAFVAPGASFMEVASSQIGAVATLTGDQLQATAPGDPVRFVSEGDGREYAGVLESVKIHDDSAVANLEFSDSARPPLGDKLLAHVVVAATPATEFVVPTAALVANPDGSTHVTALDRNGAARDVRVEVLLVVGGAAAVDGDLDASDTVVVHS